MQLNVISSTTKSKQIAEMTSITSNYNSNVSWQTIYNEISEIRKLAIETSKFLSPVLLILLMVYMFTLVHNVSLGLVYIYVYLNTESNLNIALITLYLQLDQIFNPNDVMFVKIMGMSIFLTLSHYAIRVIFVVHFASSVYQASQSILLKIEDSFEELAADNSGHVT